MDNLDTLWALFPFQSRGSHWVSAGYLGEKGNVDIQKMRYKEISLHTPSGSTRERMDRTLEGIREGWLRTDCLITHRYAVEQVSKAWDMMLNKREPFLGVVLDW